MPRDGLGFYRYLPVSRRDLDWGLCVYGGGSLVIGPGIRPNPHPPEYEFSWNRGRRLVDKFCVHFFAGGSDFEFESEASSRPVMIRPGAVWFLFPGVWHRYRCDPSTVTTYHWAVFGGEIAERWQRRGLISPDRPVLEMGGGDATASAFERFLLGLRGGEIGLQQRLASTVLDAVGAAVASHGAGRGVEPHAVNAIDNARRILEENVGEEVDLNRLATVCGLTYRRFREDFVRVTGMSPYQYHLQARIQRAKALLESSALPIKEIAGNLRFSDQYHFAKLFKQKTGKTPTQWRAGGRT
jgi:AraC-like DNA-binding protein